MSEWTEMRNDIIVWIAVGLFFILPLPFFLLRSYRLRARLRSRSSPTIHLSIASSLMGLGCVLTILDLQSLPFYLGVPLLIPYAAIFGYYANKQIFSGNDKPIFYDKVFWYVTLTMMISIVLNYLRRDNPEFFVLGGPFRHDIIYYSFHIFYYHVIFVIIVLTYIVFIRAKPQPNDIVYMFRRKCGIIGTSIVIFCALVIEVNLVTSIFLGDQFRHLLNMLFYVLYIPAGLFLGIGSFNQSVLERLLRSFEERNKQRINEAKRYYHRTLMKIVRGIHYRPDILAHLPGRLDVEIESARYIIWSHEPCIEPITDKEEANRVIYLLRNKVVYSAPGTAAPQPTRHYIDDHISAVAQRLQQFESCAVYRTIKENGMIARKTYQPIPEIPGLPVLGNVFDFYRDRLALLLRVHQEFGGIGAFRIGPQKAILVSNPEYIHTVLVDKVYDFSANPVLRQLFYPVFGDGLHTGPNETHKRQRKLATPAFHHKHISSCATTISNQAAMLQQRLEDGTEIDLVYEMQKLTLDIIGSIVFGADGTNIAKDLLQSMLTIAEYPNTVLSSLIPLPTRWPTPRNRQFQQAVQRVNTLIGDIITERRATAHHDQVDVLSHLIRARDEDSGYAMTDAQIIDEAKTLFVAGHETIANALIWAWHFLLHNPAIYKEMSQETAQVLAGRIPTAADLPRLPTTMQALKETLRLHPSVYIISRQALCDVDLGDYYLPTGALVLVSPYVLHRQASVFPVPESFLPSRFEPAREKRLPRYAYMPFGVGARTCLGQQLALLEGQLILATLAQQVRFTLVDAAPDYAPQPVITLRPPGPMRVRVHREYTRTV